VRIVFLVLTCHLDLPKGSPVKERVCLKLDASREAAFILMLDFWTKYLFGEMPDWLPRFLEDFRVTAAAKLPLEFFGTGLSNYTQKLYRTLAVVALRDTMIGALRVIGGSGLDVFLFPLSERFLVDGTRYMSHAAYLESLGVNTKFILSEDTIKCVNAVFYCCAFNLTFYLHINLGTLLDPLLWAVGTTVPRGIKKLIKNN